MENTYIKQVHKQESQSQVKQMCITAVCIALVYIATAFINFQLPFGGKGGLVHLGNVPLFIAAIVFGKKVGAIAGGVGMAAFDLLSGWTLWAPFTLVIVACMGYVTGAITAQKHSFIRNIIAMIMALMIKIIGYYIAEAIIYGNVITPIASIPGNIMQVTTAIVIVSIVVEPIYKIGKGR